LYVVCCDTIVIMIVAAGFILLEYAHARLWYALVNK